MVVPVGVEPTLYGLKDRCISRSAKAPLKVNKNNYGPELTIVKRK